MSAVRATSLSGSRNESGQLQRLDRLIRAVWQGNSFYIEKWRKAGLSARPVDSPEDLAGFPLTTRVELTEDQGACPPFGTNLTFYAHHYHRVHRSSGTTGRGLYWLDTAESWDWCLERSAALFRLAGLTAGDRVWIALALGSSLGPWIIYEGARRLGCASFAGGASWDPDRLASLARFKPSVLLGRPGRLIVLGRWLRQVGREPRDFRIAKVITSGEHAGAARAEIEDLDPEAFLAETIHPASGEPAADGESGELVLTTLGRVASPIIRYRTGDLTRLVRSHPCSCGAQGPLLLGGVARRGTG
jgi:phenylacetate-CoA ligase